MGWLLGYGFRSDSRNGSLQYTRQPGRGTSAPRPITGRADPLPATYYPIPPTTDPPPICGRWSPPGTLRYNTLRVQRSGISGLNQETPTTAY